MAVESAGPYASLHLTQDRQLHQHPTTLFFTGRMPFLPPKQQRQSTEGTSLKFAQKMTIKTGHSGGSACTASGIVDVSASVYVSLMSV